MRACRAEASKTETQTTDPTISLEIQRDICTCNQLYGKPLGNAIDSDIFDTFTVQYILKKEEKKGIEKKIDL